MLTHRPVHPGEILSEELEESGVSATELARQIEVPPNRLSQIIHGRREVSADTALRLGHWFKTGPEFWMNLQAQYNLAVAESEQGKEIAAPPRRREKPVAGPRRNRVKA